MRPETQQTVLQHPAQFTSGKVQLKIEAPEDDFSAWIDHYLEMVIQGVRSDEVTRKITFQLRRFHEFFQENYGHSRLSTCLKRDVLAWQKDLKEKGLATATINNHLATLSGWITWVNARSPMLFHQGDPTKSVGELSLPPLEPRALSETQVRSLKNVCDRLSRFHEKKGRSWNGEGSLKAVARPCRDRAIIFLMLSTGLRREEVTRLNLQQIEPYSSSELRQVKKARVLEVIGKGKTERTVFLSKDARNALADYLDNERRQDAAENTTALFLSSKYLSARKSDGRLSPRSINLILEQIGRWHDSEMSQKERKISPLRPHDLRHTFAFQLATATGADAYELQRRLGHRSQRYIERYTNPPEHIAAGYVEEF